jgi:hypothetical protein
VTRFQLTSMKLILYLADGVKLAPGPAEYRDALFEFFRNVADWWRGALREAVGMLAAEQRLARLFVVVPRVGRREGAK